MSCLMRDFLKSLDVKSKGKIPKLPEGWSWSYILPPSEGTASPDLWGADAVKLISDEVQVSHGIESKQYFEVFDVGKTKKEAIQKVLKRIKTKQGIKIRWIRFSEE